ncbi:MAG: pilus assembly protein TadG-related protein [Acidimicrobiales bacterium]
MSERSRRWTEKPECGQVTLFGVGVVMMLLVVGGVSLDLWRVVAQHRALSEVADAAAAAGSNGIDIAHYRSSGDLALDPVLATSYVEWSVSTQDRPSSFRSARVTRVEPGRITVSVSGRVDFSLLSLVARRRCRHRGRGVGGSPPKRG